MFEQAILRDGPAGKRAWATALGVTSQIAIVSLAVLAPMVWPQVLPAAHYWETLAPPPPPGPPPQKMKQQALVRTTRTVRQTPWSVASIAPTVVPDRVYTIIDDPPAGNYVIGAPSGASQPAGDGVIGSIMAATSRPAPPPVIEKPTPKTPAEEPVKRYVQGGNVQLGQPLRRSEPAYPALAKSSRTSGEVQLECVVGADGRIHEVKVLSGHPFLVKAAVDAAWQWVYAPTRLNGVPIEIVTRLTFTFKLN